jgi:hypothetical protein
MASPPLRDEDLVAYITPENLHRIFLHAALSSGKYTTLREIALGCFSFGETILNKKTHRAEGKRFTKGDWDQARPYVQTKLIRSLRVVAQQIHAEGDESNTTAALRKATNKAIDLQGQLLEYYETNGNLGQWLRVGLQAYYYSFKYSYRKDRKILRAAAAILTLNHPEKSPKETATILVERHHNQSGSATEDTAGLVFPAHNGRLWVEGIETMMDQPRKFALVAGPPTRERIPSPNRKRTSTDEQIQILTGFVLGGYTKHPNAHGAHNGVFASPYVLQRVPEVKLHEVLTQVGIDPYSKVDRERLYTFETADQVLSELSKAKDYLSEQELTKDETVYSEVPEYLRYHSLWDSNWSPDKSTGEEGRDG